MSVTSTTDATPGQHSQNADTASREERHMSIDRVVLAFAGAMILASLALAYLRR